MTDIGVIGGAGYVGLVTGLGFAALGHKVTAMDMDQRRLDMLRDGKSEVYEEGLEPILRQLIDLDQISFTEDQTATVRTSRVLFIAVGTPPLANGAADLSSVIAVAEQLRDDAERTIRLPIGLGGEPLAHLRLHRKAEPPHLRVIDQQVHQKRRRHLVGQVGDELGHSAGAVIDERRNLLPHVMFAVQRVAE